MSIFKFKYFQIDQKDCAMKIGTDALILGAWVDKKKQVKKVLDIGTGTGVLALVLAQYYPDAQIDAIEINCKTSHRAKENFSNNALGKNCTAIYGDFLTYDFTEKYDLIISNPPFFENATKTPNDDRKIARHNDVLPFEQFITKINTLLSENGSFYVVFPAENNRIATLAQMGGFFSNKVLNVYGKEKKLKRKCVAFSKNQSNCVKEKNIIIRDDKGHYTDAYIELTKELHGVKLKPESNAVK